jgi:hypothetical protein
MATPSNAPPNSITVPIPLLAILVTLLLAAGGWANSLRADVGELKSWKADHTKLSNDLLAEIRAKQATQDKERAEDFARLTAQNTLLSEKLTDIRLVIAAKIH